MSTATTMASTLHPPNRRSSSAPIDATANDGLLALDLLHEILLRLPVKPICHFRAVCTSWRSLLCHPDFIATAHGPNIAVGVCHDGPGHVIVNVLDMESGNVIKQVSIDAKSQHGLPQPHETPAVSLDRAVCVNDKDGRLCLIDPVTGAVKFLPNPPSSDHMSFSCMLGCVDLTGEYKVLAIANSVKLERQICKILTLDDNGGDHWREAGNQPVRVELPLPLSTYSRGIAVVEGVAYFLVTYGARAQLECNQHHCWILAFDLGNEVWKPDALPGPMWKCIFTLATLEGQLVACHDIYRAYVELWFLVDPHRPLWSMRHRIIMGQLPPSLTTFYEYFGKPLAVLDDGKIVMWMCVAPRGSSKLDTVLWSYDPITGVFTVEMQVANCNYVTLPPWNLLYSGRGAAVHKLPCAN